VKQSQKSLAIFDGFAAHRVETFLDKLEDNNILVKLLYLFLLDALVICSH